MQPEKTRCSQNAERCMHACMSFNCQIPTNSVSALSESHSTCLTHFAAVRLLRPDRARMWACACLRSGIAVCCLLSAWPAGAESDYDTVYREAVSNLAWMQDLRRWAQHAGVEPSFPVNTSKCGCAVSYTRSRKPSIRRPKQAFF